MAGSPLLVERGSAVLVVIDLQERLVAAMERREAVVGAAVFLIEAARTLGMPVIISRQYPRGLGDLVTPVADASEGLEPVDKVTFSCLDEPVFRRALAETGRRHAVLVGMETHVCVAQTALDLLLAGYSVHVAADGVCSRRDADHEVALDRMRAAGVTVSSAESVVYEALGSAEAPEFKAVLELVKARDTR